MELRACYSHRMILLFIYLRKSTSIPFCKQPRAQIKIAYYVAFCSCIAITGHTFLLPQILPVSNNPKIPSTPSAM